MIIINDIDIIKDVDGENKTTEQKKAELQSQAKTNGLIDIDQAPYDDNECLYMRKQYQFKPGVSVLVGCNGTGKTTLLDMIKERMRKAKIPCIMYDNLHDGGHQARSTAFFFEQMELGATLMCSSEGEQISINIANMATKIGKFVRENRGKPEIWILFDAIDSGLSVDNIVDVKDNLFRIILEDNKDSDVYIIVSANEYEMCRGEQCFAVTTGEYMVFNDYESYREFVLNSRKLKDQRYQKTERTKKKGKRYE